MKRILFVVGSLRKNSFNRQLAHMAHAMLEGRASVSYLEWEDVPLLNQDIEYPVPPAVKRIREEVGPADGLWLFSPEYNGNTPGGLKNLLDWLSRPCDPRDPASPSVMRDKLVTVCGAGGRKATASMRGRLVEMLRMMGMRVVGGTGTGVALSPRDWATDELELSGEDARLLTMQAAELVDALGRE